jgi:hypothetical protein
MLEETVESLVLGDGDLIDDHEEGTLVDAPSEEVLPWEDSFAVALSVV